MALLLEGTVVKGGRFPLSTANASSIRSQGILASVDIPVKNVPVFGSKAPSNCPIERVLGNNLGKTCEKSLTPFDSQEISGCTTMVPWYPY